jgi:hypothetical protein
MYISGDFILWRVVRGGGRGSSKVMYYDVLDVSFSESSIHALAFFVGSWGSSP